MITDLPVELLENILLLINHSVLDCTRVCSKFNAIANRVLYRNINLVNLSPWRSAAKLHAFLLAIIGQPELGKHVRFLSVPLNDPQFSSCNISPILFTEAAEHGLSQEVQQAIQDGSSEAITFLLFFYLPALHQLHMIAESSDYILSGQIRHVKPLPSGLQSVRSVSLTTHWGWDQVQPFLNLPAVDTMSWHMEAYQIESQHTDLSPSNVKHIEISSPTFCCDILDKLIRSSPSLQTFSFQCFFENPYYCSLLPLGNAFRGCVSATLESLELNIDHHPKLGHIYSLGSLRDFVHLTHIQASFSSLLDYPPQDSGHAIAHHLSDALPQSLISLVLLVDDHWIDKAPTVIEELVKIKREWLVHWKTLVVRALIEWAPLDRIELACVAEGVEFRQIGE